MSYDIPYPFRQNTDFFYLCGFLEPDSMLLLEADSVASLPEHRATLFVPRRDPLRELWDGPRSGVEGTVSLTGIDVAYNNDEIESYLGSRIKQKQHASVWYDKTKPVNPTYHSQYFSALLSGNGIQSVESLRPLMQSLRVIKSAAEVMLMKQTCSIASQSFQEVMKFSKPGINESHLYAKMDFGCRMRGAEYLAYPPVVAGGDRANIIHYIANNQLILDGEMVLMDAGCECHGYTSDITRTWPINGRFSNRQRELYEALLEVQLACIQMCVPAELTMNEIYGEMLLLLGKQLQRLGILSRSLNVTQLQVAAREFCPHHVSHYLGIDVHDTDEMPRSVKLAPGMVVTIEPGVYISKSRTDVPKELRGTGIRIEDDILITTDSPVNLCSECPKHPDDIETVMAAK
jgi:Xaa-Pro aminopeptidase